jgi:NAD(P)-dependent dehydrogenase (short-subunit alcohol dehydrogenase family)
MAEAPQVLAGRVVCVTGATRGIGFAIAARLVAAGASVAIVGRDGAAVEEARERLACTTAGGEAFVLGCVTDVADPAGVERAVAAILETFGRVDALVNNAGIGVFAEVDSMSPADWNRQLATNLTGPFLWCRALIPHMKRAGVGAIVNISSLSSRAPFAGAAGYTATKAGLNAFSEALLEEVRHHGIRVSLVLPGSVSTTFGGKPEASGADWKVAPDDVAEVVVQLLASDPRATTSRVEIRPSRKRG